MGHREALLAGARRCLQERGYARTTARDLVAASGTNLGSIGYHFGSKEALLNEAIAAAFEEWTDELVALAFADPEATPLQRVRSSWIRMVSSFEDNRALLVAFVEALAQAERSPELRAQLARCYERLRTTIASMIETTDPALDAATARHVASYHIAVCDGLIVQWLLDPSGAPQGRELVDALSSALTVALPADPSPSGSSDS